MLLRSKFFTKKKSKKGFTLVEAICAIMILAIVFVGILNAVAFSRQMVFTNNEKDKASDKAQLVADEIISTATGYDPDPDDGSSAADVIANMEAEIAQVTNTEGDPQTDIIGEVALVTTFTDPDSFTDGDNAIQYTISPVLDSSSEETAADGTTKYQEVTEDGWDITVRVYYKEINNGNGYDCVEVSAFAPFNHI